MTEQEIRKLVDENNRMRLALRALRSLAQNSLFWGWRFKVAELVDMGLDQ